MPRNHRPSVLALEGRTLLTGAPRLDSFAVPSVLAFAGPTQIVNGPDGNLWFGEAFGKIGRITPQGQVTELTLPTPAGGATPSLSAMTAGPDGKLWAIDNANDTVDRISEQGQVTAFPIPANQTGGDTRSIVLGADGNLWFATGLASDGWDETMQVPGGILPGTIDRMTPQGALTQFPLPAGGGLATGLAVGHDGIWFTDPLASRVGEIDYTGHAVEYPGPAPLSDLSPSPLAVGPNGYAYYVYSPNGTDSFVVKVAPGGALSPTAVQGNISSSNLLSGPDGIYFVVPSFDGQANLFERLNPDGTVSTIATVPAELGVSGAAFGPDGNLWFTEMGASGIGRLDLSATPEPAPGPTLVGMADPYADNLTAPVGEAATLILGAVRSSADVTVGAVTVDWGDGSSPTAGTVADTPNPMDTVFTDAPVSGSHTYAHAGSYTVTVTIHGTGPAGTALTASVVETTTAVDPTPTTQPPLALEASKAIAYQGPIAQFATPTPHDASGTDFTATIDWGDGSASTAGTVGGGYEVTEPMVPPSFQPEPDGPQSVFQVSGDHTYATAGTFTVKVTLTDQAGNSSTESTPIKVVPGPLAIDPDASITATADPSPATSGPNQDFINLGTLNDYLGTAPGRTDSATIDWGDGSRPTAATLSPPGTPTDTPNVVANDVTGTHAYAKAGSYTVKITAIDNQGGSATATATLKVSARQLAVNPADIPGTTAGQPIPDRPLATVATPSSGDPASDFTATIDWGDGSSATAGTIAPADPNEIIVPGGGNLQVSGEHTYAAPGIYPATVTVSGPGGSTAKAATTIPVFPASEVTGSSAIPSFTASFTAGKASAPTLLGSFSSSRTASAATGFTALVDWGDGSPLQPATIQPGVASPSGGNRFNVLGSHTYAQASFYTVTVNVIGGADGIPAVITGEANVANPDTVNPAATPVVAPSVPTGTASPPAATHGHRLHLRHVKPRVIHHSRATEHHHAVQLGHRPGGHPAVARRVHPKPASAAGGRNQMRPMSTRINRIKTMRPKPPLG